MESMELQSEPETVDVKTAAKIADVSATTIFRWIKRGILKTAQPAGRRMGSPHRIKLKTLRALLDGYEDKEPTP